MSPFKEPQPRRGQKPAAHQTPPISFPTPPLEDLGEYQRTPIMVLPDASNFQYRQAALQAAATMYAGATDFDSFWPNVLNFEDYLRNGPKP